MSDLGWVTGEIRSTKLPHSVRSRSASSLSGRKLRAVDFPRMFHPCNSARHTCSVDATSASRSAGSHPGETIVKAAAISTYGIFDERTRSAPRLRCRRVRRQLGVRHFGPRFNALVGTVHRGIVRGATFGVFEKTETTGRTRVQSGQYIGARGDGIRFANCCRECADGYQDATQAAPGRRRSCTRFGSTWDSSCPGSGASRAGVSSDLASRRLVECDGKPEPLERGVYPGEAARRHCVPSASIRECRAGDGVVGIRVEQSDCRARGRRSRGSVALRHATFAVGGADVSAVLWAGV